MYPFKHYLFVSLDCGHEIYKMKKQAAKQITQGIFLSENCRASTFNIRRYEIGNLYFNIPYGFM